MAEKLDPSRIMQIGIGFWASKVLLSAVELELFTRLGKQPATGASLGQDLGLAPRAVPDFPDVSIRSSRQSTGGLDVRGCPPMLVDGGRDGGSGDARGFARGIGSGGVGVAGPGGSVVGVERPG
jgi:hypothetical protein